MGYMEEEQILNEFNKMKKELVVATMDDEYFEATKETCVVLGGKLSEIRNRQSTCYTQCKDLETDINKDIVALRFEEKDFAELDIQQVRAQTPLRQLSPTPLQRHRSISREPSPFKLPALRLGSLGSITPSHDRINDPHAYFSRPGSSQSIYGGRGGGEDKSLAAFRADMEAKQADDDSPPSRRPVNLSKSQSGNIVLRSATGQLLGKSDASDNLNLNPSMFSNERPASAMSDMSINIGGVDGGTTISRPPSRLEMEIGDEISGRFITTATTTPYTTTTTSYVQNFDDDELNLDDDFELKQKEEEEARKRAADEELNKIKLEAKQMFEEKEKLRRAKEEAEEKAEQERLAEKKRLEKEQEIKEREEKKAAEEKKFQEKEEKRRLDKEKRDREEEKKKQAEIDRKAKEEEDKKKKKEDEKQKKEEEKKRKLEEKKEKMKKAEEAKKKKKEKMKKAEEAKALKAEKSKEEVKRKR